ncbi:hypothetical protein [Pseudomonas mandelii]|uniref:hypothetical protein n=1 Tax=Pseudomonas mandelii TaxID=75612 RepID=UPI00130DDFE6|nr:hypothetical protein [Pseudomonas mandelii]
MREILTREHVAPLERDVYQCNPLDIYHSPMNLRRLNGRTREIPPTMAEAA